MSQLYFNTTFATMNFRGIENWISSNRETLIGSALFSNNSSIISKLICWIESKKYPNPLFTPSHIGTIIEIKDTIYCFDMKPPFATVTKLSEFLYHERNPYLLVLRDFELNTQEFSKSVSTHVGEWYPYFSAISSAFSKRPTVHRCHCSERHLVELQKQGLYPKVYPEITPIELLELLVYE